MHKSSIDQFFNEAFKRVDWSFDVAVQKVREYAVAFSIIFLIVMAWDLFATIDGYDDIMLVRSRPPDQMVPTEILLAGMLVVLVPVMGLVWRTYARHGWYASMCLVALSCVQIGLSIHDEGGSLWQVMSTGSHPPGSLHIRLFSFLLLLDAMQLYVAIMMMRGCAHIRNLNKANRRDGSQTGSASIVSARVESIQACGLEIEALAELKRKGLLTEEEFNTRKAAILERI